LVLTRCGYPRPELLLPILLGKGSFGSRLAFPTRQPEPPGPRL